MASAAAMSAAFQSDFCFGMFVLLFHVLGGYVEGGIQGGCASRVSPRVTAGFEPAQGLEPSPPDAIAYARNALWLPRDRLARNRVPVMWAVYSHMVSAPSMDLPEPSDWSMPGLLSLNGVAYICCGVVTVSRVRRG